MDKTSSVKDVTLRFRLTGPEAETLKAKAEAEMMPLSVWIRRITLAAATIKKGSK